MIVAQRFYLFTTPLQNVTRFPNEIQTSNCFSLYDFICFNLSAQWNVKCSRRRGSREGKDSDEERKATLPSQDDAVFVITDHCVYKLLTEPKHCLCKCVTSRSSGQDAFNVLIHVKLWGGPTFKYLSDFYATSIARSDRLRYERNHRSRSTFIFDFIFLSCCICMSSLKCYLSFLYILFCITISIHYLLPVRHSFAVLYLFLCQVYIRVEFLFVLFFYTVQCLFTMFRGTETQRTTFFALVH